MCSTVLITNISRASSCFIIALFGAHLSVPCSKTGHTKHFTNLNLVSIEIALDLSTKFRRIWLYCFVYVATFDEHQRITPSMFHDDDIYQMTIFVMSYVKLRPFSSPDGQNLPHGHVPISLQLSNGPHHWKHARIRIQRTDDSLLLVRLPCGIAPQQLLDIIILIMIIIHLFTVGVLYSSS